MIRTRGNRQSGFPVLEVAGLGMILVATILLVTQLASFSSARRQMPPGLVMGTVPVSGLSRAEAQAYVEQVYGRPISVFYGDQEIRLSPDQVGLRINTDAMLSRADERRSEGTFWSGFWNYLWRRPEDATNVDLEAEYSQELLRAWIAEIAGRYDRPPLPSQPVLDTLSYAPGEPGFTLDQEAAFTQLDEVLRRPTDRTVHLVIQEQTAPPPDLDALSTLIVDYLVSRQFDGVASAYVIDLQSGDEMDLEVDLRQGGVAYLNCDVAYASTSTMKIPIMVDFFRYLDWVPTPGSDEFKILTETMTLSGNISANFMMQDIGFGDPRRGTESVTASMQYLGLENTFIVAPYDDTDPPEYYSTPAREASRDGTCVNTRPDPYMQTTVDDLAMVLDMIYQCAEFGGGDLVAAFPGDIWPDECQMMIDLMEQNGDGILMAGLPADIEVAHKHGWATDTHGDTGIVFTPGGNYILVVFLWADVDWLEAQISFPLIQAISAATFNFFNPDLILQPRRGFNADLGVDG